MADLLSDESCHICKMKKGVKSMADFLSVPQMASKIKMSDNAVRRYINRFPEFFSSRVTGGVKKYPENTVKLLERIAGLYKEGKKREQIRDYLKSEFRIVNPEGLPEGEGFDQQGLVPGTVIELGPETRKFLKEAIRDAFVEAFRLMNAKG